MFEKLYRFFFGDDIFISYARSDAIRYVPKLAARLAAEKHICFFDQLVPDPNQDLPQTLKKKILRSTVFVLIGTKNAVSSNFVRKEIELFRSTHRPFIPVDVDGALVDQQDWKHVLGIAKIREEGARVLAGDPSPEVVDLIKDSFRYTRRNQWLRASLLAGVSVIVITAAVSLLLIGAARAQVRLADSAKATANQQLVATNRQVDEQRQQLESLKAETHRLEGEAEAARNSAKASAAQQKTAEQAKRQAQALERQSAMRAADTSRREEGSRSALLSREPGREADGLKLAVQAAEESVAQGGDIPGEVMDGITTSVMAVDYSLPVDDTGASGGYPLISPNGEKILGRFSNDLDESTRLVVWDVLKGKKAHEIFVPAVVMASSFSRDGRRLAILSSKESQIKLDVWDLLAPEPKRIETGCSAKHALGDVALDNDGSHILVGSTQPDWSMNITVCEISTGREQALTGLSGGNRVAFTPNNEPAIYGFSAESRGDEPIVMVYFPLSSRQVVLKSPGQGIAADFAGFGDDGSIITMIRDFSASGKDRVYVQSPDGSVRRLAGYRATVMSAAFVRGEARVVTVSGRSVRIADTCMAPNLAALRAHGGAIDMVAFSPDGATVLTIADDGKGRLWDVKTGNLRGTLAITDELLSEGPSQQFRPKRAAFQVGGKQLVTVNEKGEIKTWDTETGRSICSLLDRRYILAGVSFLTGRDYLMAAYSTSPSQAISVDFLESRTCKLVETVKLDEKTTTFSFTADGNSIITGVFAQTHLWFGYSSELKFWDLREIDLKRGTPIRLASAVIARPPGLLLKYLFDGTRLLTLTQDEAGDLWVSGRNLPVHLEMRKGDPSPFLVAFSADGTHVADVSRKVRVWDTRSGKLLVTFEAAGIIDSSIPFSLSPDGSKLVIGSSDHTVRIYPTSQADFLGAAKRLLKR